MNRNDAADERLYSIKDDPEFSAGPCGDGRQALLGLHYPEVVVYFFDRAGRLVETVARPVAQAAPEFASYFDADDPDFRAALATQLAEWKRELGFRAGSIRVRKFADEERKNGIDDGLDLFDPWPGASAEDVEQAARDRKAYLAAGRFEFSFGGRTYTMSGDGRVLSN